MIDARAYDFYGAVSDLIENDSVLSMADFVQHGNISCLEHCLFVSYMSYKMCKALGLDAKTAARGGLLHDFFLYDWHDIKIHLGYRMGITNMHGFSHPGAALKNAEANFELTDVERDIILRHMWPLTIKPPKYAESLVVCMADKLCAVAEATGLYKLSKMGRVARNLLKEAQAVG